MYSIVHVEREINQGTLQGHPKRKLEQSTEFCWECFVMALNFGHN